MYSKHNLRIYIRRQEKRKRKLMLYSSTAMYAIIQERYYICVQ